MKEAKFDAVAEHYDTSRGGERRGRLQARQLQRVFRRDAPLVDIGAGTGVVALGLSEFGYEVLAIDLSFEMSRAAHRRLGARVVVGDALCLPFPDGVVAQAYSSLLLHHVPDIPRLLREVARVLRPAGRYVVLPGGDETVGGLHPAMVLVEDLVDRVAPEMMTIPGDADDLPGLSQGTGLRVTGIVPLEEHTYAGTSDDLADGIENRAYPYLRALDDDVWRREVEPTIALIRALPEDERVVRQRVRPRPMVVMDRA